MEEEVQEIKKVPSEWLDALRDLDIASLVTLIDTIKGLISDKKKQEALAIRGKITELFVKSGLDPKEVLSDYISHKLAEKNVKNKYRNPKDHTKNWSGRGRRPKWFSEAVEAGASEESLLA